MALWSSCKVIHWTRPFNVPGISLLLVPPWLLTLERCGFKMFQANFHLKWRLAEGCHVCVHPYGYNMLQRLWDKRSYLKNIKRQ